MGIIKSAGEGLAELGLDVGKNILVRKLMSASSNLNSKNILKLRENILKLVP